MSTGVCIFTEHFGGQLAPVVAELVTAAQGIKKVTGEPVQAILAAEDCNNLIAQLEALEIDEIYAVETGRDILYQDDAGAQVFEQMIRKIDPASVLVPASTIGKSIFSRVAARIGCGMTADCTELAVKQRDDGSHYIDQIKPSYGENIMVSIVTKPEYSPQMVTIRQGVYEPGENAAHGKPTVKIFDDIAVPDSKIRIVSQTPSAANADSIMGAEVVVVGGRGALEGNNYELLQKFADKIGGAIGGTRPLADDGMIPFENQIGQTGCTIRPKICISFGVSGAIQHTEGIKDTNLYIAVNTDPDAPVFGDADYGVVADMNGILESLLEA